MRTLNAIVLTLALIASLTVVAVAEEPGPKGFPELKAFHDVMAQMWHVDFPKDDWAAIRTVAPKLSEAAAALVKAELPANYAERKAQYAIDVKLLADSVANVVAAAKGDDDAKLKQSVIKMHEFFHDLIYNLNSQKEANNSQQYLVPE
ncbi:MAG: hypothetical protein P9L99_03730 [Candidatus Lernaella stagnicola]|nr:hypothetical protein [Candidatus Lernaella stagnicola]